MQTSSPVIPYPMVRPYAHLEALDPNRGEYGSSSKANAVFGIFSHSNNFCYQDGAVAYVSGVPYDAHGGYEQILYAQMYREANPMFHQSWDWDKESYWTMKDPNGPHSVENLDWEKTDPRFHPYKNPNKRAKRSAKSSPSKLSAQSSPKKLSFQLPVRQRPIVAAAAAPAPADTTMVNASSPNTSSSESEDADDFDDGASTSSSDICMMRALNGETFEGEYDEESPTSSSGSSSSASSNEAASESSHQNPASATSSPLDALHSAPTGSRIADYIARLDQPDTSINTTRSIKVPVGPSKKILKKPKMKFNPTSRISGADLANFIKAIATEDPTIGEKIEIDDDAPTDAQYIEMDLALGVLEENKAGEDIALQSSSSSDDSSSDSSDKDADVISRLTDIKKSKGKEVQREKPMIEEL